jgi:hypothetical protein
MPLRRSAASDLLTGLMRVNGPRMAPALYDRESQFEERLADTEDVTHIIKKPRCRTSIRFRTYPPLNARCWRP